MNEYISGGRLHCASYIFGQLFGRGYGLINWVLSVFGAGHIDWRAGEASSQIAISAMIIWRWTGYNR